jgi:hypothetical protein
MTLQLAADALGSGHVEMPAKIEPVFIEKKPAVRLRLVHRGMAVDK